MSTTSTRTQAQALGATAALALTLASLARMRRPTHTPTATAAVAPESRRVQDSSVSYAAKISPEHCDEHGRVYGGELLKFIDVAAGVVAAKHAGGPCLTISVDRVIFLQEIKVGDVVHLSSAVNRAWGSSMEIGVRVMRETSDSSRTQYCCHAYLTFVAKPPLPSSPSITTSLLRSLSLLPPPPKPRAQVPQLTPHTTLESKRFLLAGRRRAHRIQGRSTSESLLSAFRVQLLELERLHLLLQSEGTTEEEGGISKEQMIAGPVDLIDTMVMSLWIVRPQHCNSKQILFGGTLMRWIEEISSVAARRVAAHCPWSSAAIDSLSFRSAVLPGEVVYIRACVIKEDRNSPSPKMRLVSEAFFSLVAVDPVSGRPMRGGLRPVRIPEGAAQTVAAGADKRREERLQDKRILQRVYA
ncbi:hypothetical protein RQP46_001323 [Phenoliferia psychrophenolica]